MGLQWVKQDKKARNKNKLEYSQRLLLIVIIVAVMFVFGMNVCNFLLYWFEKPMVMTQEVVASINQFGGLLVSVGIASYSFLTGFRAHSGNKYGITTESTQIPPAHSNGNGNGKSKKREAEVEPDMPPYDVFTQ
jgi:hypothetical protein